MSKSLLTWAKEYRRKSARAGEDIALTVDRVVSDGELSVLGRIADLGLASGEAIAYFGTAPLGEPIYICVRETVVALRLEEAALIHVSEPRAGAN